MRKRHPEADWQSRMKGAGRAFSNRLLEGSLAHAEHNDARFLSERCVWVIGADPAQPNEEQVVAERPCTEIRTIRVPEYKGMRVFETRTKSRIESAYFNRFEVSMVLSNIDVANQRVRGTCFISTSREKEGMENDGHGVFNEKHKSKPFSIGIGKDAIIRTNYREIGFFSLELKRAFSEAGTVYAELIISREYTPRQPEGMEQAIVCQTKNRSPVSD